MRREVCVMPNYFAHEFFGQRIQGELPHKLRSVVEAEPEAFRCGLYGPDPLLFIPGALNFARLLHSAWREHSFSPLQLMLACGSDGEKSYAAGYLCHLLLDDSCHKRIYALMREQGLSHRLLEIGLDGLILRELGLDEFPSTTLKGKVRISHFATELINPIKPMEYWAGLSGMGLLCKQMNQAARLYRKKLTTDYKMPIKELLWLLEEALQNARLMLDQLTEGEIPTMEGLAVGAY